MRIVTAGESNMLEYTLHALRATHSDLALIGHASDEGELFRQARILHPDLILIEWTFRSRLSADWAAYLSAIAGGAQVIAVYTPEPEATSPRIPENNS